MQEKNIVKINEKAVSYIVIKLKRLDPDWRYQMGRKRRFLPDVKEGFIRESVLTLLDDGKVKFTEKEVLGIEKNSYIENNTVFVKPHVEIYLNTGYNQKVTRFFETKEELMDFLNKNFAGIKLIEV